MYIMYPCMVATNGTGTLPTTKEQCGAGSRVDHGAVAGATASRGDVDPIVAVAGAPAAAGCREHADQPGGRALADDAIGRGDLVKAGGGALDDGVGLVGDEDEAGAPTGGGIVVYRVGDGVAARAVGSVEDVDPIVRVGDRPRAAAGSRDAHGAGGECVTVSAGAGRERVGAGDGVLFDGERLAGDEDDAGAPGWVGIGLFCSPRDTAMLFIAKAT